MRLSWHWYLGAASGVAVLAGAFACASAPRRSTLSLYEADLAPAPIIVTDRAPIDQSTQALLDAIETHTGERPAIGDNSPSSEMKAISPTGDDVITARRVLAMDILRLPSDSRIPRAAIGRARSALRWDLSIGLHWSEVDARLVQQAIERADSVLGPVAKPQQEFIAIEPSTPDEDFQWPVAPVRITGRYGMRTDPFGEGIRHHNGLDLSGLQGQRVASAAGGVVIYAGRRGAYGLHVEIRHANGFTTRYAHLSAAFVALGDHVHKGSLIGHVGQTGRATGPHLHFELWHDGLPQDPLLELPEPTDRRVARSDSVHGG